ncbi:MAG: amidohydrolase family protein [Betaproteobacteria bacterium]|jgi:aminocarboxymuconate-semialdehyde decarboxylase
MLDIFNHFMPDSIFNRLEKLVPGHVALKAFPERPSLLDLSSRLKMMDEFEGLQQVLSLANPPIEILGGPDMTPLLAQIANDGLAEICSKHPDRFPCFIASMPMNNVDACLKEIDRSVNQLGAKGIQIFTNVLGKPLSLPEFRPIFKKMHELDLPVWIHPIRGPQFSDYASEKASENEIWFSFGWPYETTACATRLIFSGLYDEMPNLKLITHHMGGMIPYFAGKIELGFDQIFYGTSTTNPQVEKAGLKKPILEYYKMLYGDTALNGGVAATQCGHSFFGSEHAVFATDAPFDAEDGRLLIRTTIAAVQALQISQAERDKIFFGNAKRLLKLS